MSNMNEPIAIIGTACRFPGSASSQSKLWELLKEPRDLRQTLPDSRFNPEGVYHPDPRHHGTSNVKHSYILEEDHRHFDAQFFGIKPSEARSMDPQQRHLLEVVYEGLETAGQRIGDLKGSSTAVYVGLMYGEYGEMLTQYPEDLPTYTATGTARSIMANRISYFFDWHGPCMTIDTACSSSLVALHHAVQALRLGECSIAIAAGSNLCLGPESYIAESKLQMLSPNGRSRMWDADADGYARGDGVAAVVLKKLKDAIADGDDIECLIRETAVNQDGRTNGITMPNSQAQAALIRKAYSSAGLDLRKTSDRPQYFEAHGTGTPTGDPLEAAAIQQAFFPDESFTDHPKLFVGSIKSIIGHTEGTAGLAGIIKASLAIQHRMIPPNMWFHKLNPAIEKYYTHLHVPTEVQKWPGDASATPRASVNSFGFGGTNAHAILEGMPLPNDENRDAFQNPRTTFAPLTFSAQSEAALLRTLSQYVQYMESGNPLDVRDFAHTLNCHRSELEYRYSFGMDQDRTLLQNLKDHVAALQSQESFPVCKVVKSGSARVLGIFTGQGAQHAGMLRELYYQSPALRERIEEFEASLAQLPKDRRPSWSLKKELLAVGRDSRIGEAALAQPLSTVVQIVLVDILLSAGLRFAAVVGHSSGEIAASYAAGFLRATDAVRIAYLRGLMVSVPTEGQPGRMMAVGTSHEDAAALCSLPDLENRICIAAVNSSSSLTLSGDADAIEYAKNILEDESKFVRVLKVDHAYHSHHMKRFADRYSECLRQCEVTIQQPPPGSPLWVSSVDAESFQSTPPEDLSVDYWARNLTQPVLFYQAVTMAASSLETLDLAVEIGPHPALKGPASQSLQEIFGDAVPYTGLLNRNQDSTCALAEGIARVWMELGQASGLDLGGVERYLSQSGPGRILKDLPAYPWTHERLFWHEARESRLRRSRAKNPNFLLEHRSTGDPGSQFRWYNMLTPREIPWLSDHRIQGQRVFPAAGYVAVAIEAAAEMSEGNEIAMVELQDIVLGTALNFDDEDSRVEVLFTLTDIDHIKKQNTSFLTAKFHYFSVASGDKGPMLLNAEGNLVVHYGTGSSDLPPCPEMELGFVDVDKDRFYDSLAPLGYGYTGPFRALSSLRRKLGAVHGLVSNPTDKQQPLIVHPAMLDCTIQTTLLAFGWPGDGRLWSLHIPTRIKNVVINPRLSPANLDTPARHYTFNTALSDGEGLGVTGDVSIHTSGGSTLLRMEGIHAIPLERGMPDSDRRLFSKVVWNVDKPDAVVATREERASSDDYKTAELLERVSHFYLRRLNRAFPPTDPLRSEGPWVSMLGFAQQTVEAVRQGYHVSARTDWVNDDEQTIASEIAKFPANIDLKIARIIGKNIIGAVRGEYSMLEHLRVDDTLDDYYANAMGTHYTEYVARTARQLSFKHPDLNFLEIGAGTGAATKSILREIGKSYSSYTFTDISGAFFDVAQTNFSDHLAKMKFSTLDIERDPEPQGYEPQSYDVVVASFVVHATRNLQETLKRIRRLLKPGGYLLLLEVTNLDIARISFIFGSLPGWWLGEEDNRRYTPCVDVSTWGELLLESGFSGLDTVTPDEDPLPFPVSLIVSQAVDEEISFLRDPLYGDSHSSRESGSSLLIVGGRTGRALKLARTIERLTAQYFSRGILVVPLLEHVQPSDFDPSGSLVLCLQDLDKAVFDTLDSERFRGLKTLFNHARGIVWITNKARDEHPFHRMSIGFGRSMQMEMPHVKTQYIDIDDIGPQIASTVSELLLVFESLTSEDGIASSKERMLWSLEPELCVEAGKQLIHRLVPDDTRNLRYNSTRRNISLEVQTSRDHPVAVSVGPTGYRLLSPSAKDDSSPTNTTYVETRLSTVGTVELGGGNSLYVGMGYTIPEGRPVAFLSESLRTIVSVPKALTTDCSNITPRSLGALIVSLVAGSIVRACPDSIVVVEPSDELASAIRSHSSTKARSVLFLTTDAAKVQPHHQYIHPNTALSDLDRLIPRVCRQVLLSGRNEQAEHRVKTWADSRQVDVVDLSRVPHKSSVSASDHLQKLLALSLRISARIQTTEIDLLNLADIPGLAPARLHKPVISLIDWSSTKAQVDIEPIDKDILLRSDRTYWLVGLSQSLGISLCGWMIDHGAKYIVISSRNPTIDRTTLDVFRRKGAVVKVLSCDVANKHSVVAAYAAIKATMPPIAGVANGAMVLRDVMLDEMSIDDMNAVIHPKVIGSIHLDELFSKTPLDFFIFLSSAIAITGNVGQCNYAVANMFMHGLAAKRRKRGMAASVIVIGVILGVGYVTRETSQGLQDNLKKSGHTWMSERDFHLLFAEAIQDSPASRPYESELIVGLKTILEGEDHMPPWAANPRFSHLILRNEDRGAALLTSSEQLPLRTKFLEATSMEEIYNVFKDGLYQQVISMLHMDHSTPASRLLQCNAASLGIDSLNAVDLRTWFMKEAKVDVPVLRILGGTSLGDLLEFALGQLSTDVAPAKAAGFKLPAASISKPPTAPVPPSAPAPAPPSAPAPAPPSATAPVGSAPLKSENSKPAPSHESTSETEDKSKSSAYEVREGIEHTSQDTAKEPGPSTAASLNEAHRRPGTPSASENSLDGSYSIINESASSSVSSAKASAKEPCDLSPAPKGGLDQSIVRSVALSRGQSRFWFLQNYVEDPTSFNISCLFRLQGRIDVARLQKAVRAVGNRHEALRTAVSDTAPGTPEQHVLLACSLYLETRSWSDETDIQSTYAELKAHRYNVAQGKLMRIILLSPENRLGYENYLLIGYHHINMDGVSLEIILKELEAQYMDRNLGPDPFQFPDHAAYECAQLSSGRWQQHIDYWKKQLTPIPDVFPILPFPEAGNRQAMRKYRHVTTSAVIDVGTKRLVQLACTRYKVSTYHFYLASYQALLARWAGSSEVCIGSSYANRRDPDKANSVGLYLNPVGLRMPYYGKRIFASALATTRQICDEAALHSELPFDVVLDGLAVERNPAFSPVFQTFINYRPRTDESRTFGGSLTLTGVTYQSGTTPYDIMLDIFDGQQSESRIEISLQAYLYPQRVAEALAKSYISLVRTYARNQMQELDSPSLHDDKELQVAGKLGRGSDLNPTWGPTVIHRLEDVFKKHPERVAITDHIHDPMTFSILSRRVNRLYEALSDAGVPMSVPIGVHVAASSDWICSMLAVMKFGCTYVALDTQQDRTRLQAIVGECQPTTIIVDEPSRLSALELSLGRPVTIINLTELRESATTSAPIRSQSACDAAFYYTSGSTGIPKGIPLTHEGIINHMEAMSERLGISSHDVVLQQTAFSFDFSLWQILIALSNGASVAMVPDHLRRDATGIVDLMLSSNVTVTATTPSEYISWFRYGATKLRNSKWKRILCGGEPMPPGFLQDLRNLGKPDLKLEHLYGPTEVTFIATTCELDYSKDYAIVPIGRALPNYFIEILDHNGKSLPSGVKGEIAIGGVGVATRYLNLPQESEQRFRRRGPSLRFHMTGDEGWLSSEGLLYICGRISGDTQVKLRGQRLDLLEVEKAIVEAASGSILEANVSACHDASGAVLLVAQVILQPDPVGLALPQLAASLPLPPFMRPSVILAVESFPVTAHGKRDRRALADIDISRLSTPPRAGEAELTTTQRRVAAIWKQVLPSQAVETHTLTPDLDFFSIGGNSLSILEMQRRIRDELGVHLEVATLFESSYLGQMAHLVDERGPTQQQLQQLYYQEKQLEAKPLSLEQGSHSSAIDWEEETRLDDTGNPSQRARATRHGLVTEHDAGSKVIVLTGATGFLGLDILEALVRSDHVTEVHCLAVRQPEKLSRYAHEPKVRIHAGDLAAPRLGLSENEADEIFNAAHTIIHNGADVSFLKPYGLLRQANVQSTRELVQLSTRSRRGGRYAFHYVSTAGVVGLSGRREFPEITASGFYPPTDGSAGYSASKWASERLLERAAAAYRMPVVIYRPTNITGDQTPALDLVHNVVHYSRVLRAVPDPSGVWDGFINFVSVATCTRTILAGVLDEDNHDTSADPLFNHVTGPEDIPVEELRGHLEATTSSDGIGERVQVWYRQLGLLQWVDKAERAGLHPLLAAYLRKLGAARKTLYLTRVLSHDGNGSKPPSLENTEPSSWYIPRSWRLSPQSTR